MRDRVRRVVEREGRVGRRGQHRIVRGERETE